METAKASETIYDRRWAQKLQINLDWILSSFEIENRGIVEVAREVVYVHGCGHNYNLLQAEDMKRKKD